MPRRKRYDVAGRPVQRRRRNLLRELPPELCRLLELAVETASLRERAAMLPELERLRDAEDVRRFLRARGWIVEEAGGHA